MTTASLEHISTNAYLVNHDHFYQHFSYSLRSFQNEQNGSRKRNGTSLDEGNPRIRGKTKDGSPEQKLLEILG